MKISNYGYSITSRKPDGTVAIPPKGGSVIWITNEIPSHRSHVRPRVCIISANHPQGREEHGRARERSPRCTGGRALPRRVRSAAGRRGGCLAGSLAGGDQRERPAQLEADQRHPGPDEPGPLPGVGQERLLLRIGLSKLCIDSPPGCPARGIHCSAQRSWSSSSW